MKLLFSLQVKLPPAHLSTTHGVCFPFSLLNVKQGSCKYLFFTVVGLTRPGTEPVCNVLVADALSTRLLIV